MKYYCEASFPRPATLTVKGIMSDDRRDCLQGGKGEGNQGNWELISLFNGHAAENFCVSTVEHPLFERLIDRLWDNGPLGWLGK